MSTQEFLERLIRMLDAVPIPHMLAGSFASTFHGTPRTTQDVDMVIDPDRAALREFVRGLPSDEYYVSAEAAEEAFRHRAQFNVIDLATAWKVDFIIRKERPFSVEEFRRREPARIEELDLFVATAEDTVLTKLEWAKKSGSELQLRDVQGILDVRGDELDRGYITKWASQ